MSASKLFRRAAAVISVVMLLAGCSPSVTSKPHDAGGTVAFTGSVPEFTGPWAEAFTRAYKETNDELTHRILATGTITDADYAELSSAFVKCMKDKGVTATVEGAAGQASTDDVPGVMEAMQICDGIFSVGASLHGQIIRNPENLNENVIVAACLVRVGLVPPSYTANSYAEELKTQKFSYDLNSSKFMSCISSPLAGAKTDAAPK